MMKHVLLILGTLATTSWTIADEPVTVDNQPVVRANQDTLYSYGVFDLTRPVTIIMPEAAGRFQSLRAINQDHYIVSNTFDAGVHVFDQKTSARATSKSPSALYRARPELLDGTWKFPQPQPAH